MSLHDEPTDRLTPVSLHSQPTDRLQAVPPPKADKPPLVTWSWRTATALGLAVVAVCLYAYALLSRPGPPPAAHTNAAAGFSIQPPDGWTDRIDDRDGSFIRPDGPDADRRSSLTVSVRLARDPDPKLALADIQGRGVAGPIRELRWEEAQRVTLDSGLPAVLAEFTQIYRGVPMRGWAMLAVHDARLLHAVAAVPEARVQADQLQLVAALHTLSPLTAELPDPATPTRSAEEIEN